MKMSFIGCSSCHDLTKTDSAWHGPKFQPALWEKVMGAQHHSGLLPSNLPSCELPDFPCKSFAQLGHSYVHHQTEISFGFHIAGQTDPKCIHVEKIIAGKQLEK